MKVLAIAGSLREQSFNRGLIRAAQALAPAGMEIIAADISDIPLYNGDDDGDNRPAPVTALAEQVKAADALLFATPEYNYSIPGVLKNAIDWLSRVPGGIFAGKPAAIMGASMGGMGTSRSQYHLRQGWCFWMCIRSTNRKCSSLQPMKNVMRMVTCRTRQRRT